VAAGYEAKLPALFKTVLPYFARFAKFVHKKPIKSGHNKSGDWGKAPKKEEAEIGGRQLRRGGKPSPDKKQINKNVYNQKGKKVIL
jgi:hypothetical protein